MVGVHNGFVWVSHKVWSPSCEGMDYGEKFFIVYVPVSLRGIESSGKESDRMELAFLIPLCYDLFPFLLIYFLFCLSLCAVPCLALFAFLCACFIAYLCVVLNHILHDT